MEIFTFHGKFAHKFAAQIYFNACQRQNQMNNIDQSSDTRLFLPICLNLKAYNIQVTISMADVA